MADKLDDFPTFRQTNGFPSHASDEEVFAAYLKYHQQVLLQLRERTARLKQDTARLKEHTARLKEETVRLEEKRLRTIPPSASSLSLNVRKWFLGKSRIPWSLTKRDPETQPLLRP